MQIIVHRSDNLLYYGYVRKIDKTNTFGIGVAIDKVFTDTSRLFDFFDDIYSQFALSGIIIAISTNGKTIIKTDNIQDEKNAIEQSKIKLEKEILDIDTEELPPLKLSVSKDIHIKTSLSSPQEEIIQLLKTYSNIYIGKKNSDIRRIDDVKNTIKKQNEKIQSLSTELDKEKKRNKNFKTVFILSCIIVFCIFFLINLFNKQNYQELKIGELYDTIKMQDEEIDSQIRINKTIEKSLQNIKYYTYTVGPSVNEHDSYDNSYILWLESELDIKLLSFDVKADKSGDICIALFDSTDNKIATFTQYIYGKTTCKIDCNCTIRRGLYYLKIINNDNDNIINLLYHSTSQRDYENYKIGPLKIKGTCSYQNRNNANQRFSNGYYQYFYNIQYKIL
ncbi:MAG: hypothetical protein IJR13_03835 [Bacteroidales bacterium]|nr:hypothetical protein [Bacteroidales bacterium]